MKQEYFISLIVPVRNDGFILRDFMLKASELLEKKYAMHEILVVDDDSHDDTQKIIDEVLRAIPCVRYIQLAKHYGREIAISAGLDNTIGDFAVIMDLHRDPLPLVPEIIAQAIAAQSVVYGVSANAKSEHFFSRAVSPIFYWYCNKFLHIHVPRHATDFIVLPQKAVNAMIKIKHFNHYIKLFSYYTGLKSQGFIYKPLQSKKRESFFQKAKIGLSIVILNSSHPLRFVTFLGFSASVINIVYIGYVFLVYFFKRKVVEGWITTSLQTSGMFFFLFLILMIFSEYLGRLSNESKGKEPYVTIEDKSSSIVIPAHANKKRNIVKHSL